MILADAIKRAGSTDGPKIRDTLAATKNFACATGLTSLNAQRDAVKPAVILQVKDGKFKYIETVNP
jgi:branched-chain amino acid transport system substrate-binding protein